MKNIEFDRKISSLSWGKPDYNFEHFKEIINGYVSLDKVDKPNEKEIRDLWKKLTGEEIKLITKKNE